MPVPVIQSTQSGFFLCAMHCATHWIQQWTGTLCSSSQGVQWFSGEEKGCPRIAHVARVMKGKCSIQHKQETGSPNLILESQRAPLRKCWLSCDMKDKQVVTRYQSVSKIPGLGKNVCENSGKRREQYMLFTTWQCGEIKRKIAFDRGL